jgi:hypothetical protein
MLNDNWLLGFEAGYSTFLKKFSIRANDDFRKNFNLDTHYDYSFVSHALYVGYKFLRTRELRPKIYTGLSYLSLLRLREVTNRSLDFYLKNIDPYGKIIHQQINELNNSFFLHTIGLGLEYYLLTLDITYDYAVSPLEQATAIPLYTHYRMLNISAGINLLAILPNIGKVKNAANFNE